MKCALVTGGSRGIGRAICIKLAQELSYHVLINFQHNEDAAKETLAGIEATGGTGTILKFDVGDHVAVTNALTQWESNHPEAVIEVIVNNAGIAKDGLFMWMSSEDWSSVINTTVNGFYHVTQFF
ncbi:MAG: SDR family NAD(P)-dependent oxidoreductase, partial [Sphingobacterium sp.]